MMGLALRAFLTPTFITGLFLLMLVSATFGAYPALMFGYHVIIEVRMKSVTWFAPPRMIAHEGARSSVMLLMTCGAFASGTFQCRPLRGVPYM